MAGWCRLWIPNFGLLAKPLYEAVKGPGDLLERTPECQQGFDQLTLALMKAPALDLPNLSKSFELFVHERGRLALGVLTQYLGDWKRPVGYFSKQLDKASPQEPKNLEESEKVWTKEDFPLVEEDQVKEQLNKLDTRKSMGPDGMHPRVLRELAEVIAEPLSIIFKRSWRTGEVPEDWRKANVIPVFKKSKKEDPGNYRLVSLTSIPGKMMERLVLGIISKHMEEKKAIRSSQHGSTKGKSCLTNLIAFYDGMTGWIDEGRAVDVVYLDFSRAFDTVSHSILISKLRKCGLEEWTVR
ncbi:rna-directed dna polymerase from mobile element jockey- hypothetical protein [Limosa lapponica baueri]|uniref:ribonuclease H n=1 Tax=Limosa lapponica baueri TaxID=1758121 RepID=A0A2I0TPK7_LIMLA|nr:rna-directed dna polymerase from mobile element jockey- hypothetical protein [Limosa lapponica baueri]